GVPPPRCRRRAVPVRGVHVPGGRRHRARRAVRPARVRGRRLCARRLRPALLPDAMTTQGESKTFVLGVTGGSGAPYALRLLEALLAAGHRLQLVVSPAGARVLRYEAGLPTDAADFDYASLAPAPLRSRLEVFDVAAVESTPASGSAVIDGVVLCPCSMGTLARVAHGFSSNLVERAADVALKEGRRLVVVPRETPLSVIHLRNM